MIGLVGKVTLALRQWDAMIVGWLPHLRCFVVELLHPDMRQYGKVVVDNFRRPDGVMLSARKGVRRVTNTFKPNDIRIAATAIPLPNRVIGLTKKETDHIRRTGPIYCRSYKPPYWVMVGTVQEKGPSRSYGKLELTFEQADLVHAEAGRQGRWCPVCNGARGRPCITCLSTGSMLIDVPIEDMAAATQGSWANPTKLAELKRILDSFKSKNGVLPDLLGEVI